MNVSRVCRFAFLGLAVAGMSFGLGFRRPSIIINSDSPDLIHVAGPSFSFLSNANGGGDLSFENDTGQQWFSLDFFVNLPDSQTLTCGPGPFITCTISTTSAPNGTFNYDISMGPSPLGIGPNETFSIDLNDNGTTNIDPAGVGSWGPYTQFTAGINGFTPVPEPATWGLCGLAFVALLAWRRLRSSNVS